jgi:hypothetical protein
MGSAVNCIFTISMFIVVMIFGLLHCFLSTISMVIVAGESRDHGTCFLGVHKSLLWGLFYQPTYSLFIN